MDDESLWLDCPKCGQSVEESTYEMAVFDCPACGLHFDMIVCESCGEMVGSYWGDEDICPLCVEQHTF